MIFTHPPAVQRLYRTIGGMQARFSPLPTLGEGPGEGQL
jgi:hypothetical protein